MSKYSLTDVRNAYIEAYRQGDLSMLQFIEHKSFFVRTPIATQNKTEQIEALKLQRSYPGEDNAFKSVLVESWTGDGATWIRSLSTSTNNHGKAVQSKNLEIWIECNERWQILGLMTGFGESQPS